MISTDELKKIAKNRIKDSEVLFNQKRYDGAVYLCGYSIEMALKYRICKTLKWLGFPETNNEFNNFKSFKTHDFKTLLKLSGYESKIKPAFLAEWFVVSIWAPEFRYKSIGTTTRTEAKDMIDSSKVLLKKLCGK